MSAQIIPFAPNGEVARVIGDYLERLAARAKFGAIGERTLDKNERYLSTFSRDFGQLPLARLTRNTLEDWLLSHPEWLAPATLADAVGTVMACFKWAVDEDLIIKNPLRRPRDLPSPGPRTPITKAEYRAIMLMAKQCTGGGKRRKMPNSRPFRLANWFLWRTGARPGEMRGSLWTDLDWETGVIELFEHKTARKTGMSRIIALDHWVLWLFARVYTSRPQHPNIFINSRGRPWKTAFSKTFAKFAKMAGIREEITPYCLRHGVCVDLLEHGASDRQAADFLGHKSTKYISWYGRGTRRKIDHLRRIGGLRRNKLKGE